MQKISIKISFITIWIFFIFRITSYINLDNNIFQFDFKNWFKSFQDIISIFILVGLLIYSFYKSINKKIHVSIILIIYPICALIGYLANGVKNDHQDFMLFHHFVTLTSVFLFMAAIQAEKVFDYKFKETLLKIILIFIFLFFLLNVFPDMLMKLLFNQDLRLSYKSLILIFGSHFEINQNINGSARIMFILQVIFLILFKKFILKKKILAYSYFFFSVILISMIYLLQSRLNILASFLFSFFLIFNIQNINIKKKIIYFLTLIIIPIFIFNVTPKSKNRFLDNYSTPPYERTFIDTSLSQIITEDIEIFAEDIEIINKNIEILLMNKQLINHLNIKDDFEKLFLSLRSLIKNDNIFLKKEFLIFSNSLKSIELKYENLTDSEIKIRVNRIVENSYKFMKKYEISKFKVCTATLKSLDNLLTGRLCGWHILLNDIQKKDLLFGKGFFADQVYLKSIEKISSNSWVNILYNAGFISLFLCGAFLAFSLLKFFRIKNINHKNYFISISHYLLIFFIFRSMFEDTLAFVSIDFLCAFICLLIIKAKPEKKLIR
jgi:hypothetical protein